MHNDRRSLAMMYVIPLVLMTFLYFLLGDTDAVNMKVYLQGAPEAVMEVFSEDCSVVTGDFDGKWKEALTNGDVDCFLYYDDTGETTVYFLENNSAYASKIHNILERVQTEALHKTIVSTEYVYGNDLDTSFEKLVYVLLTIISFFLVFLLSGVAFVRERNMGTLERFMLTPVKRTQVVTGYILSFGIFGAIQSVIVLLFIHFVLGIEFNGSLLLAVVVMVILVFSAVSIGIFISIFSKSEFQVVQFVPVIIIPQVFYSGFLPLETLPYNLDKLAYVMPIYYGGKSLKRIIINGEPFDSVLMSVLILIAITVVFIFINVASLKRYRVK
jgi:ABC-2 type transport system permease protein